MSNGTSQGGLLFPLEIWTRVLTDARTYSSILIQAMRGLCQDKDYLQDISKTVLNRSQFWHRVKIFSTTINQPHKFYAKSNFYKAPSKKFHKLKSSFNSNQFISVKFSYKNFELLNNYQKGFLQILKAICNRS